MQLATTDMIIIIVYFALLAFFGVFIRRIRGFGDYAVAGRATPAPMVFASLAATYIGPGYSLGLAGKGFASGFFYFFAFLFFSLQTVLVGLFVAPKLRRFQDAHSVGEVLRELYGRESQVMAGLISVGLCAGFAAVMARAGGAVLSSVLGVQLWVGVALITVVGLVYTYTGGLKSVIATEALQFCVIACGISLMAMLTFARTEAPTEVLAGAWTTTRDAMRSTPPLTMIGLALSFLLGESLIPPYSNRALAASSDSASRLGFILAGLFSVAWFAVVAGIGIMATGLLPATTSEDNVFMATASRVLPPGLLGLVVISVAAIVMSSQESVLNAGAVSFARDLVRPFRELSGPASLALSRVVTLGMGIVAMILALRAPSIIQGLLICYSIWAPTVLPVLLWGVLGMPTNGRAGAASIAGGASVSTATLILGGSQLNPATALVFGLVGAAVSAFITLAVVRTKEN